MGSRTRAEVAALVDHTLLKPEATADDVAEGSCLTARGEADDLGAVTADSVALSEPVDGSCATGRGGPGGGRGPGAGIAEDAQGDADGDADGNADFHWLEVRRHELDTLAL